MGMMRVGMGAICVAVNADGSCAQYQDVTAPAPSGGGFWDSIASLAQSWSKTGQTILVNQNIPRGVLTQTGPGGTSTYVQPEGSTVTLPVGWASQQATANASPGFGMVMIAGVGVVVLMMMMRRPS